MEKRNLLAIETHDLLLVRQLRRHLEGRSHGLEMLVHVDCRDRKKFTEQVDEVEMCEIREERSKHKRCRKSAEIRREITQKYTDTVFLHILGTLGQWETPS